MGHFATGVAVVTTRTESEVGGLTANSFCSVSLEPALVLVCVDKNARSHDMIRRSGIFAVNILDGGQSDLSDRFAGRTVPDLERFDNVAYHCGVTGAPLIDGCLAYLDCRLAAEHDAGDHTVFVGDVADVGLRGDHLEVPPLLYYRGKYQRLED